MKRLTVDTLATSRSPRPLLSSLVVAVVRGATGSAAADAAPADSLPHEQVLAEERMSSNAVGRQSSEPSPCVDLSGDRFKVIRPDAGRVVAQVIDLEAIRDRPDNRCVGGAVREIVAVVTKASRYPVSVSVEARLPFPTAITDRNPPPEPLGGCSPWEKARPAQALAVHSAKASGLIRPGAFGHQAFFHGGTLA